MKSNFLILLTFIFSTIVFAQNKCIQLFEVSRQQQIETQIQKKMKRFGYIQEGKTIFKMTADGLKIRVGKIKVIRPKYLFEWADKDMHDYWKDNGRYTTEDMDFTLSQGAQLSGRGYYVSTSPTDSQHYGTHLTIFKTSGPLFIIDDLNYNFYNDQKTLNELRQIGFAGNQGIEPTWLNIFNENTLSKIAPFNRTVFDEIKKLTRRKVFSALQINKPQFSEMISN